MRSADMLPIAQRLDQVQGDTLNAQAVAQASQALALPDGLPSARVLQMVQQEYAGAYVGFVKAQSARIRQSMLNKATKDVYLRGDGGVTLQSLMEVMDRLREGGVEKVGIISRLPGER